MSSIENNKENESVEQAKIPTWLEAKLFEPLLRKTFSDFKTIKSLDITSPMAAGENYSTIMLRIKIEMELEKKKLQSQSYILKVPHKNEIIESLEKHHNVFEIESYMYKTVLPDLANMYKAVGVDVKIGPCCFDLDVDENYVLLEDLGPLGFRNEERLIGLDMEHVKCVLHKLALYHAATATRIETKGHYPEKLEQSFFNSEHHYTLMKDMYDGFFVALMKCAKSYEGHEAYFEKLEKLNAVFIDELFLMKNVDLNEFNVLNHGDCWTNNIMFQHDGHNHVRETYLIDFQIPKYGTAAIDLMYFLFSSAQSDIKLANFDYFVRFYHENLIKNLQTLKYTGRMPTLKEIHIATIKYGIFAYSIAVCVMAVGLLPPSKLSHFDNLINNTDSGDDFRMRLFSNDNYRKHAEALFTWLNNRGAFEGTLKSDE